MFIEWCFKSRFVLPCTNRHQNKPVFSCLCLWGGAFSRNLYFRVKAGTKTNLFNRGFSCLCFWGGTFSRNLYFRVQNLFYRGLVVYVYWEGKVLLVASCTPEYKQAPHKREKKNLPIHRLQITGTSFSVQVDL